MSEVEKTFDEPLSPDLFLDEMEEVLDTPNVNSTCKIVHCMFFFTFFIYILFVTVFINCINVFL